MSKLAQIDARSKDSVQKTIDELIEQNPSQVVIWYQAKDTDLCGVLYSEGTDRTKAVGALFASALQMWDS